MLDPPRAGLTNTGKPSSAIASNTRLRSAAAAVPGGRARLPVPVPDHHVRGDGQPGAAKTSFMYSLSMLTALASTPAPT